ncbi:hypothetical protein BHM03_00058937 [Ensete ventricosum]|nr:hypothetical protein BHM03_00058937 [Ensete ventricosum]
MKSFYTFQGPFLVALRITFSARFALSDGKSPYRVVRTGPLVDRYADRPLSGSTVEIDRKLIVDGRFRPVLAEGGRKKKREKKREKNLVPQRVALPRFPRAICRLRVKNRLCDPSPPAGDFFTGGRFLLPAREEGTR